MGASWQNHQNGQRSYGRPTSLAFSPQQVTQEWSNPHEYEQCTMPIQAEQASQQYYHAEPEYVVQPSCQPEDELLENGFF